MKWTQASIVGKRVWSEGLFTLTIRAPEVEAFQPGQFLQLGFDLPDGHLHRPYSVASPHGELLDFFIVLVEDGKLTPILWKLEHGAAIEVSHKAAGSFTLAHCPEGDALWLIGTGTGLAPYIAMLRTQEPWNRYQKIIVVNGVRYLRDLAYQDEMAEYTSKSNGKFCYVPVVSREDNPSGLKGRITTCIENGSLEEFANTAFSKSSAIMLCGNPDMLDDCEKLFEARDIVKHKKKAPGQIVIERYW